MGTKGDSLTERLQQKWPEVHDILCASWLTPEGVFLSGQQKEDHLELVQGIMYEAEFLNDEDPRITVMNEGTLRLVPPMASYPTLNIECTRPITYAQREALRQIVKDPRIQELNLEISSPERIADDGYGIILYSARVTPRELVGAIRAVNQAFVTLGLHDFGDGGDAGPTL